MGKAAIECDRAVLADMVARAAIAAGSAGSIQDLEVPSDGVPPGVPQGVCRGVVVPDLELVAVRGDADVPPDGVGRGATTTTRGAGSIQRLEVPCSIKPRVAQCAH